jgi:sugar diacid utilization regulator
VEGEAIRRARERLLERLTAAVEAEYLQEREGIEHAPDRGRAEVVRRLLADERVALSELAELDYELHASWHLGLIAAGAKTAQSVLKRLEIGLGRKLLAVLCADGAVWAWLGGQRALASTDIERTLQVGLTADDVLAVGSPGKGMDGWRQTHREAQAALLVALRKREGLVRYADSPLLAAALQNDTLAKWLKDLVMPLRRRPDGGMRLFEALRAYIDSECNRRAAASVLEVDRHTVVNRLRAVEDLLGHTLHTRLSELDVALRLEELDGRID